MASRLKAVNRGFREELYFTMPLLGVEPGKYSTDLPDIEEALKECRKNVSLEELPQLYKRLLGKIDGYLEPEENKNTEGYDRISVCEITVHKLVELKELVLQGLEETEKLICKIKDLVEVFEKEAEGVKFARCVPPGLLQETIGARMFVADLSADRLGMG